MKELRRNMRLVGMLVVVAFIGLAAWFALTVFEQGSIWASDSYNTRLRATGNQRGDILDRNGLVLATTEQGKRVYPEDADVLFILKYHIVSVVDSIDATMQLFENQAE